MDLEKPLLRGSLAAPFSWTPIGQDIIANFKGACNIKTNLNQLDSGLLYR